jgi:hypothetical protein
MNVVMLEDQFQQYQLNSGLNLDQNMEDSVDVKMFLMFDDQLVRLKFMKNMVNLRGRFRQRLFRDDPRFLFLALSSSVLIHLNPHQSHQKFPQTSHYGFGLEGLPDYIK